LVVSKKNKEMSEYFESEEYLAEDNTCGDILLLAKSNLESLPAAVIEKDSPLIKDLATINI
jgi:hypothetical protein